MYDVYCELWAASGGGKLSLSIKIDEMVYFPNRMGKENLWKEVTNSNYSFDTISGPSVMTNTDQTLTAINPALTISDISLTPENEVTDNMYYNFELDGLTLHSGEIFNHPLDITCSPDGSRTVKYELTPTNNDPDANLDWITFDNNTNSLKGTAPSQEGNNTYSFYISVKTNKNPPMEHLMVVKVEGSSFEVLSGQILTYVAFGIAISLTISLKSISQTLTGRSGSPTAIWSMFNQIQLLIFLMMADTYIHRDLIEYIEGFSFTLFSFKFLHLNDVPGLDAIPDCTDAQQPFEKLRVIDFESRSIVTNMYSLLLTVIVAIALHLTLRFLVNNYTLNEESSKWRRGWNKFRDGVLEFLFFTFYARTIMEAFEALCFASISELRELIFYSYCA